MFLSVIMPAYNCQSTLENAVYSVLNQSFSEFELIIVDDGSTDTTPEIIEKLKNKDSRIKPVATSNAGPAHARNIGISKAEGEYIMFIDSDDEFVQGAFETIEKSLDMTCDMLIFGFRQRFQGKAKDKIYSYNGNFCANDLYRANLLNQVWNKAYKRSFLAQKAISFTDHHYGEDRLFNASVLNCAPAVKVIGDILYNYNIDSNVSLISGYIPDKFDACKEIFVEFSRICTDENVTNHMFLKNVLSCLTVMYAENCTLSKKEKREEADRIISDPIVKCSMRMKHDSVPEMIISRIIRTENITLNLALARSVALCQKRLLPVFLKFRG